MPYGHKYRTRKKIIKYFSSVLSKPERNYFAARLLVIIRAVEHFHKYLYGPEFLIRTYHAYLIWLLQRVKNGLWLSSEKIKRKP